VLIDRDLTRLDTLWAAAGTPRHVFPISSRDLLRVSGGRVREVAQDAAGAGRAGPAGRAIIGGTRSST
jgi:hypothetical protein